MSETTTTHPTGPRPISRLRQRMLDELAIREYIRAQEKEDRRLDQMNLFQE